MSKTNPNYYKGNGYDVLDVITHFSLNFQRGNVLKYVCRAGKKDKRSELEDLKKAATYLNREICRVEMIEFVTRIDTSSENTITANMPTELLAAIAVGTLEADELALYKRVIGCLYLLNNNDSEFIDVLDKRIKEVYGCVNKK